MNTSARTLVVLAVAATAAVGAVLLAQSNSAQPPQPAAGDWPTYNRDAGGTRHSPLAQITTVNVAQLVPAWSYPIGRDRTANTLSGGSEFTPIVVGGVLYLATSSSVVALDPESGARVWSHEVPDGVPSRRGVAYWPGDGVLAPRLFYTSERRLVALDARTGARTLDFGQQAEVEMTAPYNSAPLVYENLLIVGTNGTPGGLYAYDARTGARAWVFHSVPQPGEVGHETWAGDSWRDRPGLHHWAFSITADLDRGIVYAAFEAPGPIDYWGGDRPGDNLFANSVVAIDAATGKRLWHFQTVHHDLWDYDLPSPPGLLDVTIGARPTPILALAGKTGYLYLLNRVTGAPLFGMQERPVPKSAVPEEVSSPTQPIPVKPPPIARVSYAPEDIVTAADTTEEHAAFCRVLVERSGGFYNEGPFSPYVYRAPGAPPRSTVIFPGSVGGANWGGTASDPDLGYVFVNTMDEGSVGWIEKSPEGARTPYRRNSIVGPTSRFQWAEGDPRTGNIMGGGERGWPCQKPPWGNLVAVNAATGDLAWKVPLGVTDELGEGRRNTGRLNFGGPIATAGGLVFIGASNDRRFRAFDSRTGRELWAARLDMSAHAVPITYQGRNGKQYVAVVAAGASAIDDPQPTGKEALVAFALP